MNDTAPSCAARAGTVPRCHARGVSLTAAFVASLAVASTALPPPAAIAAPAADELPRRVEYGWALRPPLDGEQGALVRVVVPGGPAERAGLRVDDRVLAVGSTSLTDPRAIADLRQAHRPGRAVPVAYQRGAGRHSTAITPNEARRETHEGLETTYGAVPGPGGRRLRTVVTVPPGEERLTGVFVVGWLSCNSVETPREPDGVDRFIVDLVRRSGALVYRVDKPGAGDSDGVCATTDFATELESYRHAFAAFRTHPRLDPARVVVVGISNGGAFAPLVAGDAPVARYVTLGAWSKTWFERMLDLERRRLVLSGTDPAQIGPALKGLAEFHAAYLFGGRTPAEVLRERPHLAPLWYDAPDSQYGRPARYYHQLQALDVAAAWGTVRSPTLVVWGDYDWIMDRRDQEQIVELVNRNAPGAARLLVVPRADHSFSVHDDAVTAFQRMGEGRYPAEAAEEILRFVGDPSV